MTAVSRTTTGRELDVEAFSLYGPGDDAANLHFEDDGNLFLHYQPEGRGHFAGLVVVELGLDGYRTHRVRAEARHYRERAEDSEEFTYRGDRLAALDDAIEALTDVRDQLAAMRTPGALKDQERNAFEVGRDFERLQAGD